MLCGDPDHGPEHQLRTENQTPGALLITAVSALAAGVTVRSFVPGAARASPFAPSWRHRTEGRGCPCFTGEESETPSQSPAAAEGRTQTLPPGSRWSPPHGNATTSCRACEGGSACDVPASPEEGALRRVLVTVFASRGRVTKYHKRGLGVLKTAEICFGDRSAELW